MGIRTNTLGKSAIINRQLNGAYDIVEYVADNLPLLMSLSQKIDLALNLGSIADHINNNTIHLTEDEKDFINNLMVYGTVSETQFENTITNIMDSIDATEGVLESTQSTLDAHVTNSDIHYSQEERIRLNEAIQAIQSIITKGELATVAYSGSYNDLINKPQIPDLTSLTEEVGKKVNTVSVSRVGFSGRYEDLVTKVPVDNEPKQNSNNPITSNAVYELTQQLNSMVPLSQESVEGIIGIKLIDYYTKEEVDTKLSELSASDLTNYYNKEEIDTKLDNLPIPDLPDIDLSDYYTKEEVNSLLANISPSTGTLLIGEPYSLVNIVEASLGNYEEVNND